MYFCPVQLCGLAGALLWSHMTHANIAAYDLWRLKEKAHSQFIRKELRFERICSSSISTIWSFLALWVKQ